MLILYLFSSSTLLCRFPKGLAYRPGKPNSYNIKQFIDMNLAAQAQNRSQRIAAYKKTHNAPYNETELFHLSSQYSQLLCGSLLKGDSSQWQSRNPDKSWYDLPPFGICMRVFAQGELDQQS